MTKDWVDKLPYIHTWLLLGLHTEGKGGSRISNTNQWSLRVSNTPPPPPRKSILFDTDKNCQEKA